MKNIEDNSMERTAELTPAESETLLRGHVWQQPENENLVCGAISSVIGARENQQDSCYMDIEPVQSPPQTYILPAGSLFLHLLVLPFHHKRYQWNFRQG